MDFSSCVILIDFYISSHLFATWLSSQTVYFIHTGSSALSNTYSTIYDTHSSPVDLHNYIIYFM